MAPRTRKPPARAARPDDPRVVRTRARVLEAGRILFLRDGYTATTMDEIAVYAGLTKRTLYNNYPDKEALFLQIVAEAMLFAERFARGLREEPIGQLTAKLVRPMLVDLAERMALAVVRPEVVELRRLLIGEATHFPTLAAEYFERAPGAVLTVLEAQFKGFDRMGLLRVATPRVAAAQFAYLVVGAALDRAMLVGAVPPKAQVLGAAREGVETFLARYAATR